MDAGNDELFEKYLNPKNVHCLRYERSLRGEYESKDLWKYDTASVIKSISKPMKKNLIYGSLQFLVVAALVFIFAGLFPLFSPCDPANNTLPRATLLFHFTVSMEEQSV